MHQTAVARRISEADLEAFIRRALVASAIPEKDAAIVARLMAEADAFGADGHGVIRLPHYVKRIRAGGINTRPNICVVQERSGQALLDGDNALGHLVMRRAAELAMEKAAEAGVGWVGARGSNHAGPAALYARMPLERDMIGLYIAVGNANHLPPWGGTEMLLSTNPIAIAVPSAARPPIVLDMATTVAAYGKVKTLLQRGENMPVGWMIDREGKPITDPRRANDGFLLPIGGPKGYGLALIFGLLAGILNGARFGRDLIDFNADQITPTNTGQLIVAIDIAAFIDVATFKAKVDEVWEIMKSSPLLPGFDEIRLPGERSARTAAERRAKGIPLHPELDRQLRAFADELGVEPL
jgi:LDH2 family malate/lactate/ureidoglycolate dehydrogenase